MYVYPTMKIYFLCMCFCMLERKNSIAVFAFMTKMIMNSFVMSKMPTLLYIYVCISLHEYLFCLYAIMLFVFSIIRLTTWYMCSSDNNDDICLYFLIRMASQHWTTLRKRASKMSWYVYYNSVNHWSCMRAQTHSTHIYMNIKLHNFIPYSITFVRCICNHLSYRIYESL